MSFTPTPDQIDQIGQLLHRYKSVAPPGTFDRMEAALSTLLSGVRSAVGHPLQRPRILVPGLTARPWHDAATLRETALLEASWTDIRTELESALESRTAFQLYEQTTDHFVPYGQWRALYFTLNGTPVEPNRRACPRTAEILDEIPRVSDIAMFSALQPGAHIRSHCGPWNCRLTIHLGLIVPKNCAMRVANETRAWEEGQCVLFDDSFEHEAWNHGHRTRVLLLADVWHPDLTDAEVSLLRAVQSHLVSGDAIVSAAMGRRESERSSARDTRWWE